MVHDTGILIGEQEPSRWNTFAAVLLGVSTAVVIYVLLSWLGC
jgi:hypothetical protein